MDENIENRMSFLFKHLLKAFRGTPNLSLEDAPSGACHFGCPFPDVRGREIHCFPSSLLERCQHRTWTNALKLSSAKASVRGRKSTSRSTGGTHLTMQYSTVTIYTKTNLTIYAFLATLWPFVIQFTRGLFRVFFSIGAFFQSFRRFWLARCKSCKAQDCTSATVCSTVDLFNSCISGGF